jgi:hypothetical protein
MILHNEYVIIDKLIGLSIFAFLNNSSLVITNKNLFRTLNSKSTETSFAKDSAYIYIFESYTF